MTYRIVALTASVAVLGLFALQPATAQQLEILNAPPSAGVEANAEEARATGEIVEIDGDSFILEVGVFALRVDASALAEAAVSSPISDRRYAFEVGDRVEVTGSVVPGRYELSRVEASSVVPAPMTDAAAAG